ncbi:MAG: ATP-binding cassette domain-containing protein, partial [Bdellovibrionales bacterium]|nr:ATP-binding cassette domain-containing protein [Oligoflexia bacterium]
MTNLRVENLKMVMPDFILTADAFEVKAGQYLSVEARSGFGKTTLLRGLMGLQTMDKGTILLNGVHLEKTEAHTRNFG